ncbi:hypothetical protein PPACK8108_LOCUS21969 [Phakopsora pachyrhizi]|uniref:Secreted RxLR effector peptide protein n=1 Tax=Phakopsora pachyrhizi TaxID=170000 RepID=A0AAV0BLM6_PHAPC|nr:hypothetical protein PPACK8108_LOCUS21969 [Phakopsora pachyrhizi]
MNIFKTVTFYNILLISIATAPALGDSALGDLGARGKGKITAKSKGTVRTNLESRWLINKMEKRAELTKSNDGGKVQNKLNRRNLGLGREIYSKSLQRRGNHLIKRSDYEENEVDETKKTELIEKPKGKVHVPHRRKEREGDDKQRLAIAKSVLQGVSDG